MTTRRKVAAVRLLATVTDSTLSRIHVAAARERIPISHLIGAVLTNAAKDGQLAEAAKEVAEARK